MHRRPLSALAASSFSAMDLVRLSQFVQGRGLLAITVEDWILIQRSSFDLHIDDLPYHAIQVYVKVTSRSYVVRDGRGSTVELM